MRKNPDAIYIDDTAYREQSMKAETFPMDREVFLSVDSRQLSEEVRFVLDNLVRAGLIAYDVTTWEGRSQSIRIKRPAPYTFKATHIDFGAIGR